jgi:hypothetical protein
MAMKRVVEVFETQNLEKELKMEGNSVNNSNNSSIVLDSTTNVPLTVSPLRSHKTTTSSHSNPPLQASLPPPLSSLLLNQYKVNTNDAPMRNSVAELQESLSQVIHRANDNVMEMDPALGSLNATVLGMFHPNPNPNPNPNSTLILTLTLPIGKALAACEASEQKLANFSAQLRCL